MPNPGPASTVTDNILLGGDATGGYRIGSLSTTPVGFYGATGISQRSNGNQAAVPYGLGALTLYAINTLALTPNGVGINTTLTQNITTTSSPTLIGDFLFINKPTSQAGLGISNVRHSGVTNAVPIIQYMNLTGSTITPTAAESYIVGSIRGFAATTTLSPVSVAANTTAEQTFTVNGLIANQALIISKPTDQAGLGIAGCRVPANNQLAITFINSTVSAITPTATEPYQYAGGTGIDAITNDIIVGVNVGALAVATVSTTSEQAITVSGILGTDLAVGVSKPTFQAGLGIVGQRVTTNTVNITFANLTAAGVTPTASEIYALQLYRNTPAGIAAVSSVTLTPVSVAANTTAEQAFAVTGVVANTPLFVNKPSFQAGLGILGCRVSAAGIIAITFANATATAIVPTSEPYVVTSFNNNFGGAGCYTAQALTPGNLLNNYLNNEQRTVLVNMGIMAGS